eukprot:7896362-Ditylum_brightwellii.AAC.1
MEGDPVHRTKLRPKSNKLSAGLILKVTIVTNAVRTVAAGWFPDVTQVTISWTGPAGYLPHLSTPTNSTRPM